LIDHYALDDHLARLQFEAEFIDGLEDGTAGSVGSFQVSMVMEYFPVKPVSSTTGLP
jgi:hypothetical protein